MFAEVSERLRSVYRFTRRRLASRRAAAAMIVALSAPLLVAATGLSVDVGYWFQQQETLQSATDAAALAAATAAAKYGDTTAASVKPFALAAANEASNNQFNLTNSTLTVGANSSTTEADGSTVTGFTVSAQIPRGSFFSSVSGMGLLGLATGNQSTASTADVVSTSSPSCLITTNPSAAKSIYANGSSQIVSSTCAFISDSSACGSGDSDAIAADPSAQIVANAISTVGCTYANTSGGAYVGVPSGSAANGASNGYEVTNHAAAATDPLAAMGAPPAWPTMPTPGTGYTSISGDTGWLSAGAHGPVQCTGSYSGNCNVPSGNYTVGSVSGVNVQFNDPSTGNTNIIGGLNSGVTGTLTLNSPNYFIAGSSSSSSTVTTWAMTINTPTLSIAGGTDDFDGGMDFAGSNTTATIGSGTYMFSAYTSSKPALDVANANLTLGGGTYWFNGGLTVEGNSTVTFGPGIYYIENGNLDFIAGSHVTANGATFVLENGAAYILDGGTVALNMTAPTTNCVAPASYPEAAYLDGTGGEGICGVLIYQARTDLAADSVNAGANTTMTGFVYSPGGALTVNGGATITSDNSSDTFALIVNTISATGGTKVEPSESANAGGGAATVASTLLVQ
jgi:Flp pilus assembly protein TadG